MICVLGVSGSSDVTEPTASLSAAPDEDSSVASELGYKNIGFMNFYKKHNSVKSNKFKVSLRVVHKVSSSVQDVIFLHPRKKWQGKEKGQYIELCDTFCDSSSL